MSKKTPEKHRVVCVHPLSEICKAIREAWGLASASPVAYLVTTRGRRVVTVGALSPRYTRSL